MMVGFLRQVGLFGVRSGLRAFSTSRVLFAMPDDVHGEMMLAAYEGKQVLTEFTRDGVQTAVVPEVTEQEIAKLEAQRSMSVLPSIPGGC